MTKNNYLTDARVAVLGAAGMIGSNVVQNLLQLKIANNIVMYDPNKQGLCGAYEEILHCSFPNAKIAYTTSLFGALRDTSYIITSGGAPRQDGQTRDELRVENSKIARKLGQSIKKFCPDLKFLIVIANPTDIFGLTTLVYSGLSPSRVATLSALDSTRLQAAIASCLGVSQDCVSGARVYGGHNGKMAIFKSGVRISGKKPALPEQKWKEIRLEVVGGGARIAELRSRSSFQSPAHLAVKMLEAVVGGEKFPWPSGAYISSGEFRNIMMTMDTTLDKVGVRVRVPKGDSHELELLRKSYKALTQMRDKNIQEGILPSLSRWKTYNSNL